jgi:hypothetical protein
MVQFVIIDERRRELTFSAHHGRAVQIIEGFEQEKGKD